MNELPSPSQWPSKALGIAVTLLVTAFALYWATRLVVRSLPALVMIAVVVIAVAAARCSQLSTWFRGVGVTTSPRRGADGSIATLESSTTD